MRRTLLIGYDFVLFLGCLVSFATLAGAFGLLPGGRADGSDPLRAYVPHAIGLVVGLLGGRLALRHLLREVKVDPIAPQPKLDKHLAGIVRNAPGAIQRAESLLGAESLDSRVDISHIVDDIILIADQLGASDIHIEPKETAVRMSMRIDGIMREVIIFAKAIQIPLVNRLRIISRMDIAQNDVPQDGRLQGKVRGKTLNARVSVFPTHHGLKTVIRLLDTSNFQVPDLDGMSVHPSIIERYRRLLRMPQGLVIITGPAGSGKSTLLYSSLRDIANNETDRRNIVTLEDPIERVIEDINQTQVDVKRGLTFASGLRTLLRQDPDVMMVGEIRDLETAKIAMQAGQTGHLLLTTLHTSSSAAAFGRLIDMGIEPFLLSAAVSGVVAIRLVRRLCPHCRVPQVPTPAILHQLGVELAPGQTFFESKGCAQCNQSGFEGRMAVFELLAMTPEIGEIVMKKGSAPEILKAAQAKGLVTLFQDGLAKVVQGTTSVAELLRMVQGEDI